MGTTGGSRGSADFRPPRPGSSVGFVNKADVGEMGEMGERRGYAPTKEEVQEWKKQKEKQEDKKEEAIRRVITKDREFIEQIHNTKRPWRKT